MFLDEATIEVRSGRGGPGSVSFRREKFVPRGGPDGGNGGAGGSVWLEASPDVSTLLDVGRRPYYAAQDGRQGSGQNRTGRRGRDLTVRVPVGTMVRELVPDRPPGEGRLLGDLVRPGQRLCVARGGRGGRGNKAFATARRQVPRHAERGQPGEERRLYLELKLLADVGLVGLPNAGKSTLLARVSAATPKVASYPFTTLQPHLGIVELDDWTRLVLADLPGLIAGAHEGHGLGTEFLRHIERTRCLVHLVSSEDGDPARLAEAWRTVEEELASWGPGLAAKPRLVALSKIDTVPPDERADLTARVQETIGRSVHCVSSVTGEGLPGLLRAAGRLVAESSAAGT